MFISSRIKEYQHMSLNIIQCVSNVIQRELLWWKYSILYVEESLNGLSANFIKIHKMNYQNLCKHLKMILKPQIICIKIFNDHILKVYYF